MPLHRDIYWVGRQWAVTGYGMQAIDQRLNGMFDIEVSRLWEDGLIERMYGLKWINILDFDKGLAAARKRYPEPPREAACGRIHRTVVSSDPMNSRISGWLAGELRRPT